MIDFYSWTTPNGRKVSIMLEECGLEYTTHTINITEGEQRGEAFTAVSPNQKIPAIHDHETGISLMESGAILMYLAEKTGKFMPADPKARWACIEWLMWQMGGAGPMLGQVHHFVKFNPDKSEYASERYLNEGRRLYGVLDRRLADNAYMAGDEYSIADMATWPWISRFEWQTIDMNEFPNVMRWYKDIAARPAVKRGYDSPKYTTDIPMP
jgi:GSH-dependent disulfide-bond oxidoreductase